MLFLRTLSTPILSSAVYTKKFLTLRVISRSL
nr:MAG TPA: hypothetical protein [Caudoviricetes sp.]